MIRLARSMGVFGCLWGVVKLLGWFLELSSFWPEWGVPLLGALGVEFVLWTYQFERTAVGLRRGRVLVGLRIGTLMVLIWVLLQPVLSRLIEREVRKQVVVLVDDSASMKLVDDGQLKSRLALAKDVLRESGVGGELEGRIGVREIRMARGVLMEDGGEGEGWDQATDLAGALTSVMEAVPPDALAGVVLLSDGRHNRPGSVEDVARRYGILDAPIAVIASGSEIPPQDVAIVSVNAPDSVYLGDRIRVQVKLKFDGYHGQKTKVKLFAGDRLLEEKEILIPQEYHREEVRFRYVPETGGVGECRVEVEAMEGEKFAENNTWSFRTIVSDARTNVLLVDSSPRWEFRYLRNLFYGRDKSIHLQSVLLEPDRVSGQEKKRIAASASRPFGEANATMLPTSEKEWRKFDVIILGDVGPEVIGEEEWQTIQRCVEDRGALLVMVAGPKAMPHVFGGTVVKELMPVDYEVTRRTYFGGKKAFRMTLTNSGKIHPVLAQVEGQLRNEQIWAGFPEVRWRHPIKGVRTGAEVLLYAGAIEKKKSVTSATGLESALREVARRREMEEENAVLVTRQTGNGKVAILLTDRTWRLREGVGDVYHHRFWGQLVRWGAGPNLRAGHKMTRLGTDQLTYTGDDPVRVTVRLRDEDLSPRNEEEVKVRVLKDGNSVAQVELSYLEDSSGLYQGVLGPFTKSGQYEVKVMGGDVSTGFRVVGAMSGVELSETALNRTLLENITRLSGGRMVDMTAPQGLAELFLLGDGKREELREIALWDRWPVLALLVGLLTAEWVLRRRSGLS